MTRKRRINHEYEKAKRNRKNAVRVRKQEEALERLVELELAAEAQNPEAQEEARGVADDQPVEGDWVEEEDHVKIQTLAEDAKENVKKIMKTLKYWNSSRKEEFAELYSLSISNLKEMLIEARKFDRIKMLKGGLIQTEQEYYDLFPPKNCEDTFVTGDDCTVVNQAEKDDSPKTLMLKKMSSAAELRKRNFSQEQEVIRTIEFVQRRLPDHLHFPNRAHGYLEAEFFENKCLNNEILRRMQEKTNLSSDQITKWFSDRLVLEEQIGLHGTINPVPEHRVLLEKSWLSNKLDTFDYEEYERMSKSEGSTAQDVWKLLDSWNQRGIGLVMTCFGVKTVREALNEVVNAIIPKAKNLENYFGYAHWDSLEGHFARSWSYETPKFYGDVVKDTGFTEDEVDAWIRTRSSMRSLHPYSTRVQLKKALIFWSNNIPDAYLPQISTWIGISEEECKRAFDSVLAPNTPVAVKDKEVICYGPGSLKPAADSSTSGCSSSSVNRPRVADGLSSSGASSSSVQDPEAVDSPSIPEAASPPRQEPIYEDSPSTQGASSSSGQDPSDEAGVINPGVSLSPNQESTDEVGPSTQGASSSSGQEPIDEDDPSTPGATSPPEQEPMNENNDGLNAPVASSSLVQKPRAADIPSTPRASFTLKREPMDEAGPNMQKASSSGQEPMGDDDPSTPGASLSLKQEPVTEDGPSTQGASSPPGQEPTAENGPNAPVASSSLVQKPRAAVGPNTPEASFTPKQEPMDKDGDRPNAPAASSSLVQKSRAAVGPNTPGASFTPKQEPMDEDGASTPKASSLGQEPVTEDCLSNPGLSRSLKQEPIDEDDLNALVASSSPVQEPRAAVGRKTPSASFTIKQEPMDEAGDEPNAPGAPSSLVQEPRAAVGPKTPRATFTSKQEPMDEAGASMQDASSSGQETVTENCPSTPESSSSSVEEPRAAETEDSPEPPRLHELDFLYGIKCELPERLHLPNRKDLNLAISYSMYRNNVPIGKLRQLQQETSLEFNVIKDWFDDRAKLDKEMNIPIPSVPVSENWCRLEEAWLMYGGMLEDEKLLSIICQWADVPIDETRAKVVEWNKRGVGLVWTYLGVMTIKQALEEVVASIPVKPLPGYEKHWEKISTLFVKNRYNMRSLFINQVLTLELGFTEKDAEGWFNARSNYSVTCSTKKYDVMLKQVLIFWDYDVPDCYLPQISEWLGVSETKCKSEFDLARKKTGKEPRKRWRVGLELNTRRLDGEPGIYKSNCKCGCMAPASAPPAPIAREKRRK